MVNRTSLRPLVSFLFGCAAASVLSVIIKSSHKSSKIAGRILSGGIGADRPVGGPRPVVSDVSVIASQNRNPDSCQTRLFILIISDVRQKWKRDALRQSWVGKAEEKYKTFGLSSADFEYRFVVGRLFEEITEDIIQEAREQKDIVVAEQNDYNSEAATAKAVWAVRWALNHCSFSHLLKVEDHSFVNVPLVVKQWLPSMPSSSYYSGLIVENGDVSRDPEGNWYMPKENFPDSTYPAYPRLHYAMSKDVAHTLSGAMTPALEKVFYDDVGVANALRNKEISPRHQTNILHIDGECSVKNPYIILKVLRTENMLALGKKMLESSGPVC